MNKSANNATYSYKDTGCFIRCIIPASPRKIQLNNAADVLHSGMNSEIMPTSPMLMLTNPSSLTIMSQSLLLLEIFFLM